MARQKSYNTLHIMHTLKEEAELPAQTSGNGGDGLPVAVAAAETAAAAAASGEEKDRPAMLSELVGTAYAEGKKVGRSPAPVGDVGLPKGDGPAPKQGQIAIKHNQFGVHEQLKHSMRGADKSEN